MIDTSLVLNSTLLSTSFNLLNKSERKEFFYYSMGEELDLLS